MKWLCLQISLTCAVVVFVGCETDQEWMKNTLNSYFSRPRHHVEYAIYKNKTRNFIREQFQEYGLEIHSDTFPAEHRQVGTNIIGILKGTNFNTADDAIVGVAAHYDTVRDTSGVDDNGAAVAVMLQVAKKIASKPNRKNTVIFVAFDLKEWEQLTSFPDSACGEIGLCGSKHFFKEWIPSFWKNMPKVQAAIIMDTIMNFNETKQSQESPLPSEKLFELFPTAAEHISNDDYRGDFLAVIGRPADSKLMNTFTKQYNLQGQPKFEIEQFELTQLSGNTIVQGDIEAYGIFLGSDHVSFWTAGIPAIFITDTGYLRGYMKKCFHKSCDTMALVTDTMIDFATKTSKAVAATVNQLAPSEGHRAVPEFILFLSLILAIQLI